MSSGITPVLSKPEVERQDELARPILLSRRVFTKLERITQLGESRRWCSRSNWPAAQTADRANSTRRVVAVRGDDDGVGAVDARCQQRGSIERVPFDHAASRVVARNPQSYL